MPTYGYACTECEHRFEIFQSFTEDSLTECPVCQGRLRKLFNAVGVVFKGSGFYRNDSRNDRRHAGSGSHSGNSSVHGSGDSSVNGSGKDSSGGSGTSGSSGESGGSSSGSSSSTSSNSSAGVGATKTATRSTSKSGSRSASKSESSAA